MIVAPSILKLVSMAGALNNLIITIHGPPEVEAIIQATKFINKDESLSEEEQVELSVMQTTKYVGSHSQLAVFPKKENFQFSSPVLELFYQ